MKRKEMIKKLENNFKNIFAKVGYDGDLYIYCESIVGTHETICRIDENKQYEFLLYNEYHFMLEGNDEEQEKLFDIIVEYSKTPIEEREEEPRYQYFLPEVHGIVLQEYDIKHSCLNYNRTKNTWEWGSDEDTEDYQTIFTHKELKKRGVDVEELREKYDEIKVEW